ncbi:peptidase M15B and M15C DD-carboxypeptidase VanY/endolysin [Paenibacillus curdlanolyticus YK9]|uniref:Peptidase M15B and M15C DD-carboxypeptidase VanY/endolysin n=1 Tax=Paenibacillus curdlanolyticus YK9 TaxID=717606 RepID=E0I9K4_9BACL|nr:M15 family metallopeptidase [Paenibacillus curdlanolyticus]EFM11088.1 peptidase M15B and M15C DD-carboxypeptidase VanY/endolysin [Paenibacillus curdlanolyticus YK9]
MNRKYGVGLVVTIVLLFYAAGCTKPNNNHGPQPQPQPHQSQSYKSNKQSTAIDDDNTSAQTMFPSKYPASIGVIVNKNIYLPQTYKPADLVYPNVTFLFDEKIDKRKIRREAAKALERLFAAAKKDGIYLSGVSGYRSYATQKGLFERYMKRDGYMEAMKYSALPGTSEHQTGLAIDVSGSDGKCAVSSCFANTKESKWLSQHSAEYGYIIRYPKGKEHITGYKYEPWHIRYIGPSKISLEMRKQGACLEEYYKVSSAK